MPLLLRLALLWLLALNSLTLLALVADKAAAVQRRPRLSERSLLLLFLLGGSPAGFATMHLVRHKRRKMSFVVRAWLIAGAQVAGALLALPLLRSAG